MSFKSSPLFSKTITSSLSRFFKGEPQLYILPLELISFQLLCCFLISFLSVLGSLLLFLLTSSFLLILKQLSLNKRLKAEIYLRGLPISLIRTSLRFILEYTKFKMMIEKGYEARSNTNIILHLEKQRNQPTEITPLQKSLLSISKQISSLLSKYSLLLYKPAENISFSLSNDQFTFESCFNLSHYFQKQLQIIESIPQQYKFINLSPFSSPSSTYRISLFILEQLKNTLTGINNQLIRIEDSIKTTINFKQEQSWASSLQQNPPYLAIIEEQYEKLSKMVEESGLHVQNPKREDLVFGDRIDQVREIPRKQQRIFVEGRRKFMEKLDVLMVLGMVRKRQQQMEIDQTEEFQDKPQSYIC